MPLSIVLVAPRIAANVGNIARTASALGASLHLVHPFGFFMKPSDLKRSSVGYFPELDPHIYRDAQHFWESFERTPNTGFYFATKNGESVYTECEFASESVLIFGNEEEGVPKNFWEYKGLPRVVSCRIPMLKVRCLNLATSVGIIGYEVFRQWGQAGESEK